MFSNSGNLEMKHPNIFSWDKLEILQWLLFKQLKIWKKKTWKSHIDHFAELESGEMLIAQWWREACLDRDLRSTADQSLAIYCLREDSLIDLDDLACKLLPAAVLHECMYWRRGLVSCRLICIVYCLLLLSHGLLVLNVKLWSSRVLSCW